MFIQSWTDEYLRWNKSLYDVETMVVDANKVWLPDLIVRNRFIITIFMFNL